MIRRTAQPGDKWLAWWLSLAVPGAGQFVAGRWSCIGWFLAAVALASLPTSVESGRWVAALQIPLLALVAISSGEHAKRCLEPASPWPRTVGVKSRVRCRRPRGRSVGLEVEIDVHRPVAEVWPRVADLPRFLCVDPFHTRLVLMRPQPRAGVDLVLEHCAFGVTLLRYGRILKWCEGVGYAFSDCSARGTDRGFPHVFFVSVRPLDGNMSSRVTIAVRGKWNLSCVPVWLAAWWLRYVAAEHARLLRNAL